MATLEAASKSCYDLQLYVMEACVSGTPLIAIGLFADQHRNAAMAARHGSALVFHKSGLSSAVALEKALRTVIDDKT